MREYSPRPLAYHSSDNTHDQSHHYPDRKLAPETEFNQEPDSVLAPWPAPSVPPSPQVGGPSRPESPERAQARLEAIRSDELRVDAVYRAISLNLQLVQDQLQSLETGFAA